MIAKGNVLIGLETRFGADWPGQRCGAKTRRGTACQRPANKKTAAADCMVGQVRGLELSKVVQRLQQQTQLLVSTPRQ